MGSFVGILLSLGTYYYLLALEDYQYHAIRIQQDQIPVTSHSIKLMKSLIFL